MERRKIIKSTEVGCKRYQILKPKNGSNGWYEYGKRKSLKGLSDFLEKNATHRLFDIEISKEISQEIKEYMKQRRERSINYYLHKDIGSKTI